MARCKSPTHFNFRSLVNPNLKSLFHSFIKSIPTTLLSLRHTQSIHPLPSLRICPQPLPRMERPDFEYLQRRYFRFREDSANGDPLPSWILYENGSFTFDRAGTRDITIAWGEEGYSAQAAAHELKLRYALVRFRRSISTSSEFELDLLDGGDADLLAGEVFWDTGPLPRDAIHNLTLVNIEFPLYILFI
jgi:hypothetical protein